MLVLDKISKKLPGFHLRDISFTVEKGDYFILLGESGSGKSILVETIAGLIHPDEGKILLRNKDITTMKIQDRNIGLVFQDQSIFPHLSVRENIGYSLHLKKNKTGMNSEKIISVATLLGIEQLLDRRPSTLSGGELQRVALARTLLQNPDILLLDEPLSSLDTLIKSELRGLLRKIHRMGQTIVHVTHDYEEALSLGNKIAVMDNGAVIQQGLTEEVFMHPKSEFVAHFVGVKNFFPGEMVTENGSSHAIVEEKIKIRITSDRTSGRGFLLIRGEDIFLSRDKTETSATNNFPGKVTEIIPTVRGMEVTIDIGISLRALITNESFHLMKINEGQMMWAHFKGTAVRFIER